MARRNCTRAFSSVVRAGCRFGTSNRSWITGPLFRDELPGLLQAISRLECHPKHLEVVGFERVIPRYLPPQGSRALGKVPRSAGSAVVTPAHGSGPPEAGSNRGGSRERDSVRVSCVYTPKF
jgi:hypothetical protein